MKNSYCLASTHALIGIGAIDHRNQGVHFSSAQAAFTQLDGGGITHHRIKLAQIRDQLSDAVSGAIQLIGRGSNRIVDLGYIEGVDRIGIFPRDVEALQRQRIRENVVGRRIHQLPLARSQIGAISSRATADGALRPIIDERAIGAALQIEIPKDFLYILRDRRRPADVGPHGFPHIVESSAAVTFFATHVARHAHP